MEQATRGDWYISIRRRDKFSSIVENKYEDTFQSVFYAFGHEQTALRQLLQRFQIRRQRISEMMLASYTKRPGRIDPCRPVDDILRWNTQ